MPSAIQFLENYSQKNLFAVKTLFCIIMLHISAITTVIRQNLYKNMPRKVNNNGERGLFLTSIVVLPCVLSLLTQLNIVIIMELSHIYSRATMSLLNFYPVSRKQLKIIKIGTSQCRSQEPRGVRLGFAAARFLGRRVRILPGTQMAISCECCVSVKQKSLRWADHLSRGVLPSVVCLSMISKPQR